jgi:hypothetical protein
MRARLEDDQVRLGRMKADVPWSGKRAEEFGLDIASNPKLCQGLATPRPAPPPASANASTMRPGCNSERVNELVPTEGIESSAGSDALRN